MSLPATPGGRPLGWRNPQSLGRLHVGIPPVGRGFDGLPLEVLLGGLPPVYDQGRVGSCTAHALAGCVEILQAHQGLPTIRPDRMALYYRERAMEGTIMEDAGALLADGVTALRRGYEPELQYIMSWTQDWVNRPADLPHDAPRLVNSDPLIIDPGQVMFALAAGFPVAIGVQISDAWDAVPGGTLPLPGAPIVGGHAVTLVGYKRSGMKVMFRLRNSWGESWGDGGYAWMPSEYLTLGICGEAYALRAVRNLQA